MENNWKWLPSESILMQIYIYQGALNKKIEVPNTYIKLILKLKTTIIRTIKEIYRSV